MPRPIDAKIDAKNGMEHPKIKTHFARIIVSWGIGNPYYSILYYDPADDEFHQGFGSRCFDNVFKWLSEEFEIIDGVFWCNPVRHGRWIKCQGKSNIWYCSECGGKINYKQNRRTYNIPKVPVWQKNKHCRNCGAKMDGGAE